MNVRLDKLMRFLLKVLIILLLIYLFQYSYFYIKDRRTVQAVKEALVYIDNFYVKNGEYPDSQKFSEFLSDKPQSYGFRIQYHSFRSKVSWVSQYTEKLIEPAPVDTFLLWYNTRRPRSFAFGELKENDASGDFIFGPSGDDSYYIKNDNYKLLMEKYVSK